MTDAARPATANPERISFFATATAQRLLAFASLVVMLIVFSVLSPNFMQTSNMIAILQAASINGVLAIAVTLIIITGGIDLSVGTMMTFCAVVCAIVLTRLGMPIWVGVGAAIATGAAAGFISGTFVARMMIPPFIATLGMMMILRGLSLILTEARPIHFTNVIGFDQISRGSLVGQLVPAVPLPNGVLILFAVALVASFILNRTILGRYTYALGSNEEAMRLSGVNTAAWKTAIYTLAGAIVGVAGLLIASRLNSAQPALGMGYELEAIAAVVIGGTSLAGGRGTILGSLIGALIIAVLANGLRVLSVAQEWQIVAMGLIIVAAVYADQLRRRKTG